MFYGAGANDMLVDMGSVVQCMVVSSARLPIKPNAGGFILRKEIVLKEALIPF